MTELATAKSDSDGAPYGAARLRLWLVGTTMTMAILAVAISAGSWRRTASAYDALAKAQGNVLGAQVTERLAQEEVEPADVDLQQILRSLQPEGLAWIGLVAPDGEIVNQAGESARRELDALEPNQLSTAPDGMLLMLQPARSSRQASSGPSIPVAPPIPGGSPDTRVTAGRLPSVVIGFEPTMAADLLRGNVLAFVFSLLAAVLLGGIAVVVSRLARQADEAAKADARRERLAALGEMSAVLAHEIRNPLAALKGHAQLLIETTQTQTRSHKRAMRIVRAATRLQSIADGLLDFVRIGEVSPEPLIPLGLLESAIDESAPMATVHDQGAPERWKMDATRVHQVLSNLLRNAAEACPEGPIDVYVRVDQGALVIDIADRGPGIPDELGDAIFEPFRTTRTRGTGLGLAVSRRIAELHGGSLVAGNRPDGGALFRLTIPEN